jgi:hypothetical protein
MRSLMVDALWAEEGRAMPLGLQRHLATCPECNRVFEEMKQAVQISAKALDPSLSEAYWNTFYDRLIERMQSSDPNPAPRAATLQMRLRDALGALVSPSLPVARFGFAVGLILLGVLIGRFWTDSSISAEDPVLAGIDQPAEISSVKLTERTQRYLDRSNVLLLGLVNFDAAEDDPLVMYLNRKSVVAAELVEEARVLKADLGAHREQQLAQLVDDLERILLQIANLEAQHDLPSIEVIRRGVDHGSLLLKINLEQMRLVDRELGEPRAVSPPSIEGAL